MNLLLNPEFNEIDRCFADFIGKLDRGNALLPLAAAMLSRSVRAGNICWRFDRPPAELTTGADGNNLNWPAAKDWRSALSNSKTVGGPDANTPLVMDDSDRLYLRRYWTYQRRLAQALRDKASGNQSRTSRKDRSQEAAIEAALDNSLTIISGGPGTGKTTTVLRILERLLRKKGKGWPRIALVAPTGKAAARLEQTIRKGLETLKCSEEIRSRMPQSAATIHRLLGRRGSSVYFRHDQQNPLPLDLLVIDEASMVALPLLCKVFDALPAHCDVILLGDHEQLASVEPGAVLADMVDAAASAESPLASAVVTLEKNYRFGERSGVHHLCTAVRQGDADQAIRILRTQSYPDLVSREVHNGQTLSTALSKAVVAAFADIAAEKRPAIALANLERFRVLTPLRRGRVGVEALNREIERTLQEAGLIPENSTSAYPGKPILITQNDYQLHLYNGDVGVLLPDPTGENPQQLCAWFEGKENVPRRFAPARLPQHEAAYAMTVHKSQGSEFDRVLFILPDRDAAVLTRELIYTGLTRARSQVELWWNEAVFATAVTRRAERHSGLRDLLTAPAAKIKRPRQEQLRLFGD
jgi:exodeoxyribonuclease V alpha subunit